MDQSVLNAIIGALGAIFAGSVGIIITRSKDKENQQLKKNWLEYKNAISNEESYLDLDYGIKIITPQDWQGVGEYIDVAGVYKIMPPPNTLRLFTVNPDRTSIGERYWPQEIVSKFNTESKTWTARINIHDPTPNKKWAVIASIVGPSTIILWDFYYKVGPIIKWWDFEGWPPESRICHRINVIRI